MTERTLARNIRRLTLTIAIAFLIASIGVGYWTVVAASDLNADPFNPRLIAAVRDRPRGKIVDSSGRVLAESAKIGDAYRRRYPDRSLAQVVGYASFKYGASGVEGAYQESLIGQDPSDLLGQWKARYLGEHGVPGSVVLGLDPKVQLAAATALGGRRGAIVALDPKTGRILASVSVPSYDANALVDPAQQDVAWQQLNDAKDKPLINRVAQGLYPPGSTMKIITAAAALENGFDPNQKIRVDDPYQADRSWGDYYVRSSSGAHGDYDMSLAFQRSENIYFAKVGLTIGAQKLALMAQKFGIGHAPALDLPAAKGQLSNNGQLDRPTLLADTSYGQGELLTSPLQMAMVAATVANHGVQVQPHYATEIRDGSGGILRTIGGGAPDQIISPATAATLTGYLVQAVEAPGAFAFGAKIAGVHVAGKTGTAETPSGSPHGWFVGFAPAEDPQVAVAVIIENAGQGGVDAAPLGGAVMRAVLGK
ncbi:MAG TPA: penicillin-binding protein 2 [Candidatus Limnocylindria bacterium]|nr:penicillin-binding protein 2 [Candidatus Limnocylindria bacterium]